MEKHVLIKKKKITDHIIIDLPLRAWVEKTVHGVKTHWLSGKENFQVSKEGHVDKPLKGPITIDFLEKGTTVNSASYGQVLRQNSPY